MADARRESFAIHGLAGEKIEPVGLSYLDELAGAYARRGVRCAQFVSRLFIDLQYRCSFF